MADDDLHLFCVLDALFDQEEHGTRTSKSSVKLWLLVFALFDILHMLTVAFDICNFAGSRIEYNDKKSSDTTALHMAKLVALIGLECIYVSWFTANTRFFGYYLYIILCGFTGAIVHFSVVAADKVQSRRKVKRKNQDKNQRKNQGKDQRMPQRH
jgi:hypothetical protein